MAKNQFKLLPVSPLMGSTLRAYRKTFEGNVIDPQFKAKKNITSAIIYLISPFRWYEQRFVLPNARKKDPEEIVFIVGHWRSGTTYLHNLMCQAGNASFVTTYQTVFPNFMGSRWLFRPFLSAIMPDKRPADNVKLAVDFPQEEELALGGMNPHAYYRFLYFPKQYKEYYAQGVRQEGLNDQEKKLFARDYKDVIHKALWRKPGELLIVKNPVNTARIKFLHQLYPNAKWIHIYRNPFTVFISTLQLYTQLLPTLSFHRVSENFLRTMILETYIKLYEDFDNAIAELPDLNLVELRFEEFEKDPLGNLESMYATLGLKGYEKSRSRFEQYISSQQSYLKNEYDFPQEMIGLVKSHWGEYVDRWAYGVPG